MASDVDVILMESLIAGAGAALEDVARDLVELRRGWTSNGADPSAVEWLDGVIAKAGWWRGRLAGDAPGSGEDRQK